MGKKGKYKNQAEEDDQPKKKKMMITEEHLMDKTHMDNTQFVPFLPEDALYPDSNVNTKVLRIITRDLNYLLNCDFKTFWATLLYNPSLKICLSTCLQNFHRQAFNDYRTKAYQKQDELYEKIKFTETFELTQALFKVVLYIFYRITHPNDQNKELTELYRLYEQINNKYILDIPRLIELIEIYGKCNPQILAVIIKGYIKNYGGSNPQKTSAHNFNEFYNDFVKDIMEISIERMSRLAGSIKKISDREEFGIEYSYKRTIVGQLSPGEEQLRRKIVLLAEIISFYETMENISKFFPEICADYIRSNETIHQISENIFIEIDVAYKSWTTHNMDSYLYLYMNKVLLQIKNYFLDFLRTCEGLFVTKSIKSGTMGSYVKCFDRMIQFYGRRQTLGKKQMLNKRYMELYLEIIKEYKLDDLLTAIYVDEIENGTHGINVEYLVDFKFAIQEIVVKIKGESQPPQQHYEDEEETQIDGVMQEEMDGPIRKFSNISNLSNLSKKMGEDEPQTEEQQPQELDRLQTLISKKNREENYYERLYSEYRTKITVEYEDEFDDLVDFEKRPMFQDDANEREGSSDGSSQFDSDEEKLHLVKSISNVSRGRVHKNKNKLDAVMEQHEKQQHHHEHHGLHGAKHEHDEHKQVYRDSNYHNKRYQPKNKQKYEQVKPKEAQQILNRVNPDKKPKLGQQPNKKPQKLGEEKQEPKNFQKKPAYTQKKQENKNQYTDEECFQECKAKIKTEQKALEEADGQNSQQQPNKNRNKNKKYGGNEARKQGNKKKYVSKYAEKE